MKTGRATTRSAWLVALAFLAFCPSADAAKALKARIALDQTHGLAGSLVTGTGDEFDAWSVEAAPDRVDAGPSLPGPAGWRNSDRVYIHWNSLDGAVVWSGPPGLDGKIEFSFRVPRDASPGQYTVVATQTGYDGGPSGGTPARARFTVIPPQSAQAPPVRKGKPRPGRRSHRTATDRVAQPAEGGAGGVSPSSQPSDASGSATSESVSTQSGRRAGGVRPGSPRATPTRPSPGVTRAGRPSARAKAAAESSGMPWYLIALSALAVGLVAGAGGAFVLIRRRGPKPEPEPAVALPVPTATPDPVEAELQELLAEEHARKGEPVAPR